MNDKIEERIIDLESRLMFMQATVDELNKVVVNQQSLIENLGQRVMALSQYAKQNALEKDSEKPPHY